MIKLLWLIGIEGSGHHLVRDLLRDYLKTPEVIDKGPHYPYWLHHWDVCSKPLPIPAVRGALQQVFGCYGEAGIHTIYEDTSFPFGDPEPAYGSLISGGDQRGPLRCPDMLEMVEWTRELVDLRILVSYRSPVSTVHSVLRRGFSNNPRFECQLAERTHLYLSSQLQLLPPGSFRTFHFEQLLEQPQAHLESLAEWWGVPSGVLGGSLKAIGRPASREDIPNPLRGTLDRFFCAQRCSQWTHAYTLNPLLPS